MTLWHFFLPHLTREMLLFQHFFKLIPNIGNYVIFQYNTKCCILRATGGNFFKYGFFHLNVLLTSKPWHIWCFKNLQIIFVFSITYLIILFHLYIHPYNWFLFCSLFFFPCGLFCKLFFFFTIFTVVRYRPNFLLRMYFIKKMMSVVDVLVKS